MSDKSVLSDEKLHDAYWSAGTGVTQRFARLRAVAEAAIAADRAARAEPVAWEFQHEETGLTDFVCPQQVECGFEKNNPRWQKIGPVYRQPPQASATVPEDVAKDAERYRWLRSRMIGVEFDWSEQGITALSFEMPDGCAFGGNCDQNIDSAMLAAAPARVEPIGYFKENAFGWTECSPDDNGAVALYTAPPAAPVVPVVPDGCVVVPVKPTERMLDHAVSFALNVGPSQSGGWTEYARRIWETMVIAAAPAPSQEPK